MTRGERRAAMIEGGMLVVEVFVTGFARPENADFLRERFRSDLADLVDERLEAAKRKP